MDQVKPGVNLLRLSLKWMVVLVVGVVVIIWLLFTPPGLLGKADAVGYSVCHRIDSRSFHFETRQLPLCARCSGQYLGAMLGLVYQSVIGKRRSGLPPRRVFVVLAIFLAAYAVDGLNSYLHLPPWMQAFPNLPRLYEPSNTLRLLTGTGVGLGIAAVLLPAFNSTVWKEPDPRPALSGLRSLAALVVLALFLDWVVLSANPVVLYILALVTSAGVLILLTMIYTIILLMIFRYDNRSARLLDLWLPLVAGFGVTIIQIGLIDALRFMVTRTWGGFIFK